MAILNFASQSNKLKYVTRLLLGLACVLGSSVSHAQSSYPERPVTVLVPFTAGGATDAFTRVVMKVASATLGVPIVIDNRPGGNGTVAAQAAARARPDGYTLSMIVSGVFRQPYLQSMSFNPITDLDFIAMTNDFDMQVVVKDDSPYTSIKDLVKAAKLAPGKVFYGVPAPMGSQHIAMAQLADAANIKWTAVPFRGDTQSLVALLGGEIQASIVAGNVAAFESSKRVRVIASINEMRSARQPSIETLKESGYPVAASATMGVAGPKGLPPAVIVKIEGAIEKALHDPEVQAAAANLGISPRYASHADYGKFAVEAYEQGSAAKKVMDAEAARLK